MALEADWNVNNVREQLEDDFGTFGPDDVMECVQQLEARLSGADSRVVDEVLDVLLPRLEALRAQQAGLAKALQSSRLPLSAELTQIRRQQGELAKGLTAVVRALAHIVQGDHTPSTPTRQNMPATRTQELIKSLGPYAPRMAYLMKSWFGAGGGFSRPYDPQQAARMLGSGELTMAEHQRWKKFHRLPDRLRRTA